jgi:hypothetical protein
MGDWHRLLGTGWLGWLALAIGTGIVYWDPAWAIGDWHGEGHGLFGICLGCRGLSWAMGTGIGYGDRDWPCGTGGHWHWLGELALPMGDLHGLLWTGIG